MADTDPTMDLMNALNRADPSEWGKLIFGMPIFVEHEGWEVTDADGTTKLVVVPYGDDPPANGKKLYTVDRARLEAITREINKNLAIGAKPIKLFIGHSNPKLPQDQQPVLAGFGRGAYMGTFGPAGRAAIKTDAFFKHGHADAAVEYPERSPEFVPRTNAITGVALLKTDPRLPMGMLAFGDDDTVYYGVGFMADSKPPFEKKKDGDKEGAGAVDPTKEPAKKPDPAADAKPEPAADTEDESPDADADDADEEFGPHEQKFAGRLMKHLEATHPAIKYMCGEYKKYADSQAAMVAPSATDGTPPIGQPKKPETPTPEEERIAMADTTTTPTPELTALHKRIADLEHDKAVLYAEQETTKLVQMGVKIADQKKFQARLVAGTPEQRLELITDARVNYAREDRAPVSGDFLPLNADANSTVEGPQRTVDDLTPAEVSEIIAYAEAEGIDASKDAGWKKAMTAVLGDKKKSA